jgi:riboflavin synthase
MFTGLIQNVGTVLGLVTQGPEAELKIATTIQNIEIGESIAVMGACLSVTRRLENGFAAFTSAETLEKTGLGRLASGTRVNLERALKVGDALGGHLVSGHVDTRVKLIARTKISAAERLTFSLPKAPLNSQVAPKGSVTLNGVSLTVNDVTRDSFDVMVIPLTLNDTTLGETRPGDQLNIETDVLAKYVARQLHKETGSGVDFALLARTGFLR